MLDQYYTDRTVAAACVDTFATCFDPSQFLLVEPSAGDGAFFGLLPVGSRGYDIDPKFPGILTADFFSVTIESDRDIAFIGNPPFGRNASKAIRFFNHAARRASVIAWILPRTFRKASVQTRLDRRFHLIHDDVVPDDAFLFRGKPFHVPAVFQIWERRAEQRELPPSETRHQDFAFTTAKRADFAIQRVGARAGRVHHDFDRSPSSHYFIRGRVETVMRQLDPASAAANTAGNPSLSMAEIVARYSAKTGRPSILTGREPRPRQSRRPCAK